MSRARHAKRANGGSLKPDWNAGEEQNVAKEAMEKKRGGRVHGEGEKAKERHDRAKRASGGSVIERKHGGKAEEHEEKKMHHRARGGRLRGEGVGANLTPLSTAARVKHITKGEQDESGSDKVD